MGDDTGTSETGCDQGEKRSSASVGLTSVGCLRRFRARLMLLTHCALFLHWCLSIQS